MGCGVALGMIGANIELALQFQIQGYPTIKILRKGGKIIQDYKGPRCPADDIADYLRRQAGPASTEIKSADEAASLINEKKVFIVGVFPKFSGEEFDNFMVLAEKLQTDYDLISVIPSMLGCGSVSKATLRLLKPFDKMFVDSQDFKPDALERFIEESSIPILTTWNSSTDDDMYINKFFNSPSAHAKAMLFVNLGKDRDAFESKYKDVATLYNKGKGIRFLFADVIDSIGHNAFQYFGVKADDAPLLIIQKTEGQKYLKTKIEPDEMASWVKDYSEPIPQGSDDEPAVKVVVADTFRDVVFSAGKNVLLEFYVPWCKYCEQLAPTLDEVAISLKDDPDVIVAKIDATTNDIGSVDIDRAFEVLGFPDVYLRSARGNLTRYIGDRTKEDIISFIQENQRQDESIQCILKKKVGCKVDSKLIIPM
ncbi:protein disulfide-isomerase [Phtheirospermum japonicum]|uniref:Protein disulfide-isomerase n=1 Tax=Phtheirospermum japonicum TaxID=374723 RepID=A0A830C992_9LAMI|nr:protein disulfide-isomerase [Phtheirospermum japonicum]